MSKVGQYTSINTKISYISLFDVLAFLVLFGIGAAFYNVGDEMYEPIEVLDKIPVSLDWHNLPDYSMQTVTRMLVALCFSFLFAVIYAAAAAKSAKMEKILIPMLDILQSVPILGFLSFTVTGFMNMCPGNLMGVELAAIFAIFTSQAWNMTFSFYQSLKTVPEDLREVTSVLHMTPLSRFLTLELPFGMPGLVWNAMISMSGGWFFIVAAEAITVDTHKYTLPGIGSYIALAMEHRDINAVFYAIFAMTLVIIIYDQLFFRPLLAWSEKFKCDQDIHSEPYDSYVLNFLRSTNILNLAFKFAQYAMRGLLMLDLALYKATKSLRGRLCETRDIGNTSGGISRLVNFIFDVMIVLVALYALLYLFQSCMHAGFVEIAHVFELGSITALRVIVLVTIASIIWVPIGVYIGLRPNIAKAAQPIIQILAAFPVNLLFPIFVLILHKYQADPNIWLSPLMIIGTQWYILFNVIAGVIAFPDDLKYVIQNFNIRGLLWIRRVIIPAVAPFAITGAIAASGGAWNASIVAEVIYWGEEKFSAYGIGNYIAENIDNQEKMVIGIVVLTIYVTIFNRFLWQPLYNRIANKIE